MLLRTSVSYAEAAENQIPCRVPNCRSREVKVVGQKRWNVGYVCVRACASHGYLTASASFLVPSVIRSHRSISGHHNTVTSAETPVFSFLDGKLTWINSIFLRIQRKPNSKKFFFPPVTAAHRLDADHQCRPIRIGVMGFACQVAWILWIQIPGRTTNPGPEVKTATHVGLADGCMDAQSDPGSVNQYRVPEKSN
ncbi:hypothetical protein C8R44DRAFT_735814 [Mycena epipterygia]|nr:hypothetical protein C8R44DRAFT_735814 [Mycena epipterygia]